MGEVTAPIVEVTWIDAFFTAGWVGDEELVELMEDPTSKFVIHTTGYALSINDERVILAMSINPDEKDDDHVGEVYWIPRSCILELVELVKCNEEK